MRGLEAQVRLSQPDVVEASFRIGLILAPVSVRSNNAAITLRLHNNRIQVMPAGAGVATVRRNDLEIPEQEPGNRRNE